MAGQPLVTWIGSPNFGYPKGTPGRQGYTPKAIVYHVMEGTLAGTDSWFLNPKSNVSSHFGIGKKGEIHQYVRLEDAAFGNGAVQKPSWNGLIAGVNPNLYTISIEHEGAHTRDAKGDIIEFWTPTEAQYQASLALSRWLIELYALPPDREHLITHGSIDSVNRPSCPGSGFPWARLLSDLNAAAAKPVHRGENHCRQIALTFDTEFDAAVTPRLLKVLDDNWARSTFFLVGQEVGRFPDLTREIARKHEIGNHSYHHLSLPALAPEAQVREVRDTETAIAAVAGRTAKPIFRPPFGDFNSTVLSSVGQAGYSYLVHWSVAPDETSTVEREVQDLLKMSFPGGIALFHGYTPNTPPALELALPELRRRGYQFVTVTEILGIDRGARDWGGTPIHVQPGDTLESLGACYNTDPSFLARYNQLSGDPVGGELLMTPHRTEVIVEVNGRRLTFDVYPRVIDGRTAVPVRTVAEALGAQVSWDPLTRRTLVKRGDTTVEFTLDSDTAVVNGAPAQMPMPAHLTEGRTMVPARFLVEALGDRIGWDESTRTVLIQTV